MQSRTINIHGLFNEVLYTEGTVFFNVIMQSKDSFKRNDNKMALESYCAEDKQL